MLKDPHEIQIISRARQKNVRNPRRSREHFDNIFADFFSSTKFEGSAVLDLGPGQYDFCEIARQRGARCFAVDNDPAVIELGRYKGFDVSSVNLKNLDDANWPHVNEHLDGIFCKFSINAFWFLRDPGELYDHAQYLDAMLAPSGWGWIAPWNGIPKSANLSHSQASEILDNQLDAFVSLGFRALDLNPESAARYGLTGSVANHRVFVKNNR